MKKFSKIYLNTDKLPDSFYASLRSADETDLRVMLALTVRKSEDIDKDLLCRELEMTESELDASIKYWCGAGLIKKSKRSAQKENHHETKAEAPKSSSAPSAHRDGKLERKSELPPYSSTELAELIEKRHITAEFINEAQRIMGKVFNTHEVNILVGMVDYIGFDEASVIILLSHMAKTDKKNLRYAEKLAFALYDEGITDADALQNRLRKMEEYSKTENEIRVMFGMTGRSLTTKEKKFLNAWINTMGYGTEEIRLAYDITVDNTHSPAPVYANTILESWHAAGLRDAKSITEYEAERKNTSKGTSDDAKSYDTDEFFEAALHRAFDEL